MDTKLKFNTLGLKCVITDVQRPERKSNEDSSIFVNGGGGAGQRGQMDKR